MSSSGFTIHHLPYGVISTQDNKTPRLATAFEDYAIDLAILVSQGLLKDNLDASILENALSVSTSVSNNR